MDDALTTWLLARDREDVDRWASLQATLMLRRADEQRGEPT